MLTPRELGNIPPKLVAALVSEEENSCKLLLVSGEEHRVQICVADAIRLIYGSPPNKSAAGGFADRTNSGHR